MNKNLFNDNYRLHFAEQRSLLNTYLLPKIIFRLWQCLQALSILFKNSLGFNSCINLLSIIVLKRIRSGGPTNQIVGSSGKLV